ncbi:MAG: glycosyltransferase family 2 protein, partial [Candidatus Kerfeldbacteria bacterium]|nr:glycosyltransferase family 2 protein [Candidatus Kerfeldbacteria bacterium]
SQDRTAEIVRSFSDVRLIESSENRGYGAGLNMGVSNARAELLVLLNPDITISDSRFIEKLVEQFEQDPRLGVVAPIIYGPKGTSLYSAGRLPSFLSEFLTYSRLFQWVPFGRYSDKHVDWVSGTVFATRRSLWEQVHGMDEHYFLYVEDMDYCERVHGAGFRIVRDSHLSVLHVQSASTRQNSRQRFFSQVLFWDTRGVLYFCSQHRSRTLYAWVKFLALVWMCLQFLRFTVQSVVDGAASREQAAFQHALPWVWRLSYTNLRKRNFNPKETPYENPPHQ